jgi:ubiquinone/menaquinone biosynthesis C-methylase UbiE
VDAAHDRPAQAEGRKPVNRALASRRAEDAAVPATAPLCVSVSEGYARWAATYDRSPNPLLALEERCLDSLIPNLSGKCILDVACGTGRWFERLALKGAGSIVGSDSSSAMLAVAARKAAKRTVLVRADARHLAYARAQFDFALCSFAIGHIWAVDSFAIECARVLKSRAELFVTDLHPHTYALGWRTRFRDGSRAVEISSLPRSSAEVVNAFLTAGFECEQTAAFSLGAPEEMIFRNAGKLSVFEAACRGPAICLYRFRLSKPVGFGR